MSRNSSLFVSWLCFPLGEPSYLGRFSPILYSSSSEILTKGKLLIINVSSKCLTVLLRISFCHLGQKALSCKVWVLCPLLKWHEVRMGQGGLGSFTEENQDAFTTRRRTGGAGRLKQRHPLYIFHTSAISVFILASSAHPSYYSFVLLSYGLLIYTFLHTDSA